MTADVIDGWLKAWNNHDGCGLSALMANGGLYHVVPLGRIFTSVTIVDSIGLLNTISSDYSVRYLSTQHSGNMYATEWERIGTNDGPIPPLPWPASNQPFKMLGSSVGTTEGGKIKQHRDYWDLGGFLVQMGIRQHPAVEFRLAAWSEEAIQSEED